MFSSRLLEILIPDSQTLKQWLVYKDWVFIFITAMLLFILVHMEFGVQERHRALLSESEKQLRLVGDNLPDSYVYQYMQDTDGIPQFLYISAGVERLHGIKAADVLKDAGSLLGQIDPEQMPLLRAAEAASRKNLTGFQIELRMRDPEKQWRWIRVCSQPHHGPDGCVLWDGVATDVTNRKLTEDRLIESERKYRELVELANSIILRWNSEGIITFMNEFGLYFFGYSAEEIIGHNVTETIVPSTDSGGRDLHRLMAQITADPKAFEHNINENVCHNGDRVWIAWTNKIVQDETGKMVEILSIGTDITERKRAEDQVRRLHEELQNHAAELERRVVERTAELAVARDRAEAADRLKSAFLATMSHELRTPLNSIIGFTGIILQGLAGPLNIEQHKQLEMVQSSSRHLLALINEVLDISKIEAGQLEVIFESFDLRASIEKVAGIIKPLAEKKGLTLLAEIKPEVGTLVSDKQRIEQILINLLNNAVKFTERGSIRLLAEIVPDAVSLSITDTGIGIKSDDLHKLFQPFRQIDSGLTRNHEGSGLGLAICRKLAELLGGEIRVESEWGRGSTFTILLPLKDRVKK